MKRIVLALLTLALLTGCGTPTTGGSVETNSPSWNWWNLLPAGNGWWSNITETIEVPTNDMPPVVVDPEPDEPPEPPVVVESTELPFALSDVIWCDKRSAPNILNWPVAWDMNNARVEGDFVKWDGDAPSGLKRANGIKNKPDRVLGYIRKVNGKYYGGIGEWLKPGMSWQLWGKLMSNRIGDGGPFFDGPLASTPYRTGETFWIVWAPFDWVGLHSGDKRRSNIVEVRVP